MISASTFAPLHELAERPAAGPGPDVTPMEACHPRCGAAAATRRSPGRRQKVLVLCYVDPFNAATIRDHCESFARWSRHEYFYHNPFAKEKPAWLDVDSFDAVLLHYSLSIITPGYLAPSWTDALRLARARKILFIQDEYRRVDQYVAKMRELAIDVLFTCVPYGEVHKVYSPERLPGVKIFCTMTGFVPDALERMRPEWARPRPIDVGYRARDLGFWYGELGQEKSVIGRRFRELAQGTGLACDISTREEDRIYGRKWTRFLQSCRCVLGTESGASVFDFSGRIEDQTRRYLQEHPQATFEECRRRFFAAEEGKIRLNQISPRVFESIACGAGLVLFEGEYSGVIQPDVHFIPLKKDFSNFAEVVRRIQDRTGVTAMARRAYEDVIAPGTYNYRSFGEGFDRALETLDADGPAHAALPPEGVSHAERSATPAATLASPPARTRSPAAWAWARAQTGGKAARIAGRFLGRAVARRVGRAAAGVWGRALHLARRLKWGSRRMILEWQPLYRRSRLRLLRHALLHKARSNSTREKGDSPHLCQAPEGPFRQMGTVPFFPAPDNSTCHSDPN